MSIPLHKNQNPSTFIDPNEISNLFRRPHIQDSKTMWQEEIILKKIKLSMRDLKKYSIVITGAATGNGYEIAKVCSQYFSKLILIDKDKNELQKAKDKIIFNKNHNEFTIGF